MLAPKRILIPIIALGCLNSASADETPAPMGELARNAPFAGTFYGTFSLAADPSFAAPFVTTFHADGTWTAVDAGDFGTLAQAYEAVQHGSWQRQGARTVVATGLILRFVPVTGELIQLASPRLELTFDQDLNEYEATGATERRWICNSPVQCPDPFTDPPTVELDLLSLGIGLSAKRVSP